MAKARWDAKNSAYGGDSFPARTPLTGVEVKERTIPFGTPNDQ
jgi:hypothetical protein